MSNPNNTWKFKPYKRWKISAQLRTESPLHIGNGEITTHPKLDDTQVNACIKDVTNQPYLPGTTLKGNLFAWLNDRIQDEQQRQNLPALFGQSSVENSSGAGGRAEFHDAPLTSPLSSDGKNYPYWQQKTQTYIETSTAIHRMTRTVVDGKLFYTELVPPDVGFAVAITGTMTDSQAAILIAALQAFGNPEQAATLGAENTGGKGYMSLYGNVEAACMDAQQASDWLNRQDIGMAGNALIPLSKDEINALAQPVTASLAKAGKRDSLQLTIRMDGSFLINNPESALQEDAESDHQPLLDAQGNPLLSGKSLRGAMRSQAERIIRSLGGTCCDTAKPCEPLFRAKNLENLCLACQVFGATGWQSPLHIHHFKFAGEIAEKHEQEFVAIDRFHGGGKHGAKYNATSYLRPKFTGSIELDHRLPDWGKGLLALLLRDFKEGDIKLGFAANKGYGGVEDLIVTPADLLTENHLAAFRQKCQQTNQAQTAPGAFVAPPHIEQTVSTDDSEPTANSFYNPYQFIPVKKPADYAHWLNREAFENDNPHWTHPTYQEKATIKNNQNPHSHAVYRNRTDSGEALYHGRLHCKLVAETPFFIGSKRSDQHSFPAQVGNYEHNGELAIPATSLRGLLSSLTEAASNSALRVLDNGLLSYRKTMDSKLAKDRPLSAIGMVIGQGDENLKIIPLALPTLELKNGDYQFSSPVFNKMFPDGRAALKVYLNDAYNGNGEMAEFLADKNTWTPKENNQIFYLDLDPLHLKMLGGKLVSNGNEALLRRPSRNGANFIIGQNSIPANSRPIPAHKLTDREKARLTPGILRILGKTHRETDMPNTKKHELFIPVPREFADNFEQFIKEAPAFPISAEAVKRFKELADQRTDSQKQERLDHDEQRLPYHLKGTTRTDKHKLEPKHGDLVYFRPDETDHKTVAEIAFSAHWRGRVENKKQQAARVFDFFSSKDLLPFNPERQSLSPAELLFGFVEELNSKEEPKPKNALAFAGKVRIGTGQLTSKADKEQLLESEVTLKILASPKLPSPSLYFRTKSAQQTYIAKHDLSPDNDKANGRKQYLHALRKQDNSSQVQKLTPTGGIPNSGNQLYPWQSGNSDHAEQKVKIRPIKPGTSFEFSVDFDNLTAWELGLLCYALKPSETYRHKLGMGKPIGLGSVNIDIEKLELIDRQKRYGEEPVTAERYNGEQLGIAELRNTFIATMDTDIRRALELLGNPHNTKAPVHYPQVNGKNIEEETYRWFVANDSGSGRGAGKIPAKKQPLPSIDGSTEQLPPLNRHEWSDN